jgi:DNA/RNA-binding domain of Phe-tRNA-synthetase-like protein
MSIVVFSPAQTSSPDNLARRILHGGISDTDAVVDTTQ